MDIIDEILTHTKTGAELGRICGVTRESAHNYKLTRKIPPDHWRNICRKVPNMTIERLYDAFYPESEGDQNAA